MIKRPIERHIEAEDEDAVLEELKIIAVVMPEDAILQVLQKYKHMNGGNGLSLQQLKQATHNEYGNLYDAAERLVQRGKAVKNRVLAESNSLSHMRWINLYSVRN